MTPTEWKEAQLDNPDEWESLLGAIARGWCYEENANKTMDTDLALAIAKEVSALYTHPQPKVEPLTDEQIDKAMAENKQILIDAADDYWKMRRAYARIIEAAHGIGEKK